MVRYGAFWVPLYGRRLDVARGLKTPMIQRIF